MKDLIRKILKEHEEEDPLQWAVDLWNETNPIPISREHSYIINLINTPTDPDTFKWKFEELYGTESITEGITRSRINIFDNSHIKDDISNDKGIVIYINVSYDNEVSTGWDRGDISYINNTKRKIFTLLEFLRLVIVDN